MRPSENKWMEEEIFEFNSLEQKTFFFLSWTKSRFHSEFWVEWEQQEWSEKSRENSHEFFSLL